MVHRNFESTEEMVNNLLDMASRLDELEYMLASDSREILGPAPNLLVIHYQLNQLERFRNQTMHQAKKASADARNTLTRWFERLNKDISAFDEYILELARNILNLVRAGQSNVVVRLIKIVEVEGKEDEKVGAGYFYLNDILIRSSQTLVMRFVKKAAKPDAALKFKSLQAEARVLKHYRSKVIKTIIQSIQTKFNDAHARDEQDPVGFLNNLNWIYQDLIRIEKDVVPCFPADYDIYSLYVREYHKGAERCRQANSRREA
jgi:exocyst complex component 3